MKKLEKLAVKAVNAIVDTEIYGWPPVCFGTFYQPKRPTASRRRTSVSLREKDSKEKQNFWTQF